MGKFLKALCVWKKNRSNLRYSVDDDGKSNKKARIVSSKYFAVGQLNEGEYEKDYPSLYSSLPCIPSLMNKIENRAVALPIMSSREYREAEHWKKEQMLGCGQYGKCYQCLDVLTGHLMAVKQVPFIGTCLLEVQALQDEIKLLGELNHPNVIRIMGATQDSSHFNIFMEWMPGGSVASLLDKFGSFHENVIISYSRQVLTGLAYLHDKKILHRDLKGSNLLVDGTGRFLRITDFGTAGCLHSQVTAEGEFEGQVTGTVPFMAPEVIRGENYGRSSDIWSVGCVIIEMATGCLPWTSQDTTGLNQYQLMYKIARTTEPPPLPANKLSKLTRNMTLNCLKLDPEHRPSAKELLAHDIFTVGCSRSVCSELSPTETSPRSPSTSTITIYDFENTWKCDENLIGESADI